MGSRQYRRFLKTGQPNRCVDRNKQLMTSKDGDYINLEPFPDRWKAFNWDVIELDGHNMGQIVDAWMPCRP